ncbi:M23 family metallopeptidase [Leptospira sp. 201903070]|uniref:M23 family metallopeptidase n=2 Tax=Leptospira ainlahdjerensis TaxID=2810033 RepID=A0ABS2U918_9LEPT|nr:M23 family metallopeptidase [Leptospira ainlahdjerensis]
MKGTGGSLNWNQRDGVSASLTAAGGVNAGTWSQSGGFQANTNFLNDKWKADFVSGKAKEDADMQEAERSKSAQNKNNAEQGAATLAGIGVEVAGRRNEGDGDASRGTSSDPNNSKKPDSPEHSLDERISKLKRELEEGVSLVSGNGAMDESGITPEKVAAKIISQKMDELKHLESQRAGLKPQSDRSAELRAPADKGNQEKANSNTPKISGGLTEYPNGARTSIPFNEKTDGTFSQPRTGKIHGGLDLMTPIGTPVAALEDGVVTIARNKPDDYLRYPVAPGKDTKLGGASVSIRHTNAKGETVYTYYAHNSKVLVKDGQKVFKGEVIALSGQSGNTPGGAHIHQEVNKYVGKDRVQLDPLEFSWEKFNANKN